MDVVRFKGGLGNQMFQYAFLKSLEHRGRMAGASLGFYDEYPDSRKFELDRVFPNIRMDTGFDKEFFEAYNKWNLIKSDSKKLEDFKRDLKNRYFWSEADDEVGRYQAEVYMTENCVFAGYWQTEKYFTEIRKELLSDLRFLNGAGDQRLEALGQQFLEHDNYVSVHVRRGDYLQFSEMYGNICKEQYYQAAMEYINQRFSSPVFVFFSDDIEWVKGHYGNADSIYVEAGMFEEYQSWYDMYLMSCCSHNIVANSTFSWWGAWLNEREEKLVIAPKKWMNILNMTDICPKTWIRL